MSDCCSTTKDGTCSVAARKAQDCPSCGKKGKPVAVLTVKSLARDHTRPQPSAFYSFCRTAKCEVVYFSDECVFTKSDVKVRVGIKESVDPIPLCYCFDYNREDIRRELEATGRTSVPDKIKAEVERGFCSCEVKNPRGVCCLGDIARAIRHVNR